MLAASREHQVLALVAMGVVLAEALAEEDAARLGRTMQGPQAQVPITGEKVGPARAGGRAMGAAALAAAREIRKAAADQTAAVMVAAV